MTKQEKAIVVKMQEAMRMAVWDLKNAEGELNRGQIVSCIDDMRSARKRLVDAFPENQFDLD